MNKNKVLGAVLMLVIILGVFTSYKLGFASIQYATSGTVEFLDFLSRICVVLFGSFVALTLDKQVG
jgi:hypothetical protein